MVRDDVAMVPDSSPGYATNVMWFS